MMERTLTMPNWGFYEWLCILILSGAPTAVLVYLAIKALPGLIREISIMWHAPDPRDNHKGP